MTDAEVDQVICAASNGVGLRAFVAGLLAERAALAEALDEFTHEYRVSPGRRVSGTLCTHCYEHEDAPVHRTPARVRAEQQRAVT